MLRKIQYILFLLCSVIFYGQVTLVTAVESKEYKVNEKIKIRFILRIEGNDYVQESRLRLPDFSKFNVVGSGSENDTYADPESKTIVNQQVAQWVVEPKYPGKVRIGSAIVEVSGKLYKTEPIDIFVSESSAKEKSVVAHDDVYLNMEVENTDVFKNEPTIAIIKAYSKNFNNLRNVGEVNFTGQKGVEVRPVSFNRSDIEQNTKTKTASQVVAVVMIYPEKAGFVELKPATAVYNNGATSTKIKSNKVNLRVKRLPSNAPKGFENAVGDYQISLQNLSPKEKIEVNKPFNVVLKLSGVGNLNESNMPKLQSNSEFYSFYRPRISSSLRNTVNGHKGEITAKYLIIPKVAGDINIKTEKFAFFNPKTGRYKDAGLAALALHVSTPEEIFNEKSTIEKVNDYSNNVLQTVSSPIVNTQNLQVESKGKINWKVLFANYSLIGAFIGLILIGLWFLRKFFVGEKPGRSLGTIAETEKAIKAKVAFDYSVYRDYLSKLIREEKFNEFFSNLEQMNRDAEKYVSDQYGLTLNQYFDEKHGSSVSEKFRVFEQHVQMEKFSPFHTQEHLFDLLSDADSIYKLID